MVEISILDHKRNEMPNFVAVGEDVKQAVDIFVILYNAYQLTNGGKFQLTNGGKDFFCATYVVNMNSYDDLRVYMKDVHNVNLIIT
jgi:hypothetical protein